MNYDVFISYARKDDVDARVSTFVDALSRFHKVITGDDLRVFFDRDEIRSGDDWYLRLLESLRSSASMVALLSPAYLESEYCWIEWTTFERQAAVAMAVDQGIKPLVVVPQPGLETALDTVNPTWLVGRTPWRTLLDPLQRGTVDLTAVRDIDDLLNRLTEESIRRRLADLTGRIEIEDTFTGELVESVRWIRRLRLRRDKAKASSGHRMPTLRPGFVGRVPELRAMRRALAEGTEVAVSAEGVGGIGKTEIAIAYAHAFAWDYPGGRWFIPAEGATNLAPLLANAMAEGLGVILTPEQLADPDGGFRYIVSRLRTLTDDVRKVLVVLDNVDQDELVSAEAVRSLGVDAEWFDLIITSRKRLRGGSSDGTLRLVRIDVLPERELLTLLGLSPDATTTERDVAAILLERTGRLTLAVEIAGAYCRRNSVSLSDYVADLEDVLEGLSDSLYAGAATEINHSTKYVDHLFRRSVESLSHTAKMILGYACRMHPDHIVIPWLNELCCREDSTLAKRKLGKTAFEQALLELQNASLMEAPDATGRICRMHRLLGDTVRRVAEMDTAVLSDDVCPKCGSDGTDCAECSPSRDSRLCKLVDRVLMLDWFDVELRWQLEPIRAWLDTRVNDLISAKKCDEVGETFRLLARFIDATPLLRRALLIRELLLGRDHSDTLSTQSNLADLVKDSGDFQGAEQIYRQLVDTRSRILGSEHSDTLDSINDLAHCLLERGDIDNAEAMIRGVLGISENALGSDHSSTEKCLNSLGFVLVERSQYAEAEEIFRRCINISEQTDGADNPYVSVYMNNVAYVLDAMGDRPGAEQMYRSSLVLKERILGNEHPATLNTACNLANVIMKRGDLELAMTMHRRILEIRERIQGSEHPDTLTSMNNLAAVLKRIGNTLDADAMYRFAHEILERTHGPDHPRTMITKSNLADLVESNGDLSAAAELYQQVLDCQKRILGWEHTDTLKSIYDLGKLREKMRDLDEAEALFRMELEACVRLHGAEHEETISSVANLGRFLKERGDLVGAEPLYRRALEARERILGPEHPDTLRSVNSLAILLKSKGDLAGAEPLYRRALVTRERILGLEHPDTTKSANALSRLLESRHIVESIKGRMDCERCLGTGFVAHADIVRLGMQSEWKPGPCKRCREAAGIDDKS